MRLQLYSIEHAPASLPVWQVLMADLGDPPPARVAKALGIGERTVYRYNSTGYAPKPVALAVFWLTRWGRSMVNAQATNDAIAACEVKPCAVADDKPASVSSVADELLKLKKLLDAGAIT